MSPLPAPPEKPTHTPDRLRRAWSLVKSGRVEILGDGKFKVLGNDEPEYYVDLSAEIPCTCADTWFHSAGWQCKHLLGARLANQDTALLMALIEMMTFVEPEKA